MAQAQVTPRYAHSETFLPDRSVLIVGGFDATNAVFNSVEIIRDDGSVAAGPTVAAVARASHTATLLPNGEVLVAGGWNAGALNTVAVYNPNAATPCWHTAGLPTLNAARFNHTAVLLTGLNDSNRGRVLICGGNDAAGNSLRSCEIFTPTASAAACGSSPGSITNLGNIMKQARSLHTASVLPSGKIFFAGGYNATATPSPYLTTTELFDNGSFSSAFPLSDGRALHSATVMGDGKVLISGGYSGIDAYDHIDVDMSHSLGFIRTVEVYDPIGDKMVYAAPMAVRRLMHTSTLNGDGSIDLNGGLGNFTDSFPGGVAAKISAGTLVVTVGACALDGDGNHSCPVSSNMTFNQAFDLKDHDGVLHNVTGVIHHGTAYFYADPPPDGKPPSITFTGGTVEFTAADEFLDDGQGFRVGLEGATARCYPPPNNNTCGYIKKDFQLALPDTDGQAAFTPNLDVLVPNAALGNSPLVFTPFTNGANCPQITESDAHNLAAGTTITVGTVLLKGLSEDYVDARIANATLTLTAGGADYKVGGNLMYAVNMTRGVANLGSPVPTIQYNSEDKKGQLTLTDVAFNDPTGTVVLSSASCNPPYPVNLTGLTMSGMVGTLDFVPTQVKLSTSPGSTTQKSLTSDGTRLVVNTMSFGDDEQFQPRSNTWSVPDSYHWFGTQAYGQTVAMNTRDSFHMVGGRSCDPAQWDAATPVCNVIAVPNTSSTTAWVPIATVLRSRFANAGGAMSSTRANHTATTLPSGKVLVAGGTDGSGVIASADLLDTSAVAFAPTGSMREVRQLHTATLLPNGRVLVAGGYSTNAVSTGATRGAELYFPDVGLWLPTTPLISARTNHTAALLPDGNVLAAGGYAYGVYLSSAEVYYSTSGIWQHVGDLLATRSLHTSTLLPDGRVLVIGGQNEFGVLRTTEFYDPRTGQWSAGTDMPQPLDIHGNPSGLRAVRYHTATLMQNGSVLVAGGNDGAGSVKWTWSFDPLAAAGLGAWTQLESLNKFRQSHTATLLPNGNVMVAGGAVTLSPGGASLMTTEYYDSSVAAWSLAAGLSVGRAYHTMTAAPTGMLYAIGGLDGAVFRGDAESNFYTGTFDMYSTAQPSARRANITSVDLAVLDRGLRLTAGGYNFLDQTEAAGGGGASANSDHRHPRLLLQSVDGSGGSSSQNDSGFILDLSTQILAAAINPDWGLIDSSITVSLPLPSSSLPYGWYHLRVGANDQLSPSRLVQAGPIKPPAAATAILAPFIGTSSITYTWTAPASGVWDGYDVYTATTGVFQSTVPAGTPTLTIGASDYYVQTTTWLPSGYHVVMTNTLPASGRCLNVSTQTLSGLTFFTTVSTTAAHPTVEAGYCVVYSTLTLAGALAPSSTQQVRVAPYSLSGDGPPLASDRFYTWPHPPRDVQVSSVSANSLRLDWDANGNFPGTVYEVSMATDMFVLGYSIWVTTPAPTHFTYPYATDITTTNVIISALNSNTTYYLRVRAYNIAGNTSPFGAVWAQTTSNVMNLSGRGLDSTTVYWQWDEVPSAQQYNVYSATTPTTVCIATATTNFYRQRGLVPNSQYAVKVAAVIGGNEGPPSDPRDAWTWTVQPATSASNPIATFDSIKVFWTQSDNPLGTSYQVRFSTNIAVDAVGLAQDVENDIIQTETSAAPGTMSTILTGVPPATRYRAKVSGVNRGTPANPALSTATLLGVLSTGAQAPFNLRSIGKTPSSISLAWDSGNSSMVSFEVSYATSAAAIPADCAYDGSVSTTIIPFSQGFNGSSVTLSGLLTSTTYCFFVQARPPLVDPPVADTQRVALPVVTDNGGGPLGTLSGVVSADKSTSISGTIGLLGGTPGPRTVLLYSPARVFPSETTLTISTFDASGGICGGDNNMAFAVNANPPMQPTAPLFFTIHYDAGEPAGVPASLITMMRYDPVGHLCVPLQTGVDTANKTITAKLNHLSVFQVGRWNAPSTPDETLIFPNPFHTVRDSYITFNAPGSAHVRVFTLRGELVFDQTADARGVITWPGTNRSGRRVASGVYLVLIESVGNKAVKKLAIVR